MKIKETKIGVYRTWEHFVKIKEKIRKNSRVGIFIKQYMGIACADVAQYGQCGGMVASIKGNKSNAGGEWEWR